MDPGDPAAWLPWHWDYKPMLPRFVFYVDIEIELKSIGHRVKAPKYSHAQRFQDCIF